MLRHRIVLSYDALSDGVTADELLERVLDRGPRARRPSDLMREATDAWSGRR